AARLDRLSDPERRTIERASVVGKEFGQREVSELTPVDGRAAVGGQLMTLVRKELIRPERRRDDGGETFRFRHLLIRDAAYDSLPKAERAELHERFADWLESSAGERVAERDEIVGYHLAQARSYRLALGPDDAHTKALALRAGRRPLETTMSPRNGFSERRRPSWPMSRAHGSRRSSRSPRSCGTATTSRRRWRR